MGVPLKGPRGVEIFLVFNGISYLLHLCRVNRRRLVTKRISHESEYSSHFLVVQQTFKRRHRHLSGVFYSIQLQGVPVIP